MTQEQLEQGELNFFLLIAAIVILFALATTIREMYVNIKYYYKLGKQVEAAKKAPRKVPTILREEWGN